MTYKTALACPDCGIVNGFDHPVTTPMTVECGTCGYAGSGELWIGDLRDLGEPSPEVLDRLHAMQEQARLREDAARFFDAMDEMRDWR